MNRRTELAFGVGNDRFVPTFALFEASDELALPLPGVGNNAPGVVLASVGGRGG